MKKIVRFICLLIVAALIAVLVLNNGAKADDDENGGGDAKPVALNLTAEFSSNTIKVGETSKLTLTFSEEVTSFSGTVTYSKSGIVRKTGDNSIVSLDGSGKVFDFIGEAVGGPVTITINLNDVHVASSNTTVDARATANITVIANEEDPGPEEKNITLSLGSESITVGGSTQANVSPQDVEVTFSSSDEGVALVEQNGKVTGVSAGTATITATSKAKPENTSSVSITVTEKKEDPDPGEQNITLSLESGSIIVGGSTQANVSPQDVEVTFSSNNEGVASVEQNGKVTGVSVGTATITATSKTNPDNKASVDITVAEKQEDPPAEGEIPQLTIAKSTIKPGGDITTVRSNIPVKWASSNTKVAVVSADSDDRTATIISDQVGEANIVATALTGGKTASVKISVKAEQQEDSTIPKIYPSGEIKLEVGQNCLLESDKDVNWSSSDASKATVSGDGTVTAHSAGTVTITATSKSNNKTASKTITIVQPNNGGGNNGEDNGNNGNSGDNGSGTAAFYLTPNKQQTLKVGGTLQLKASGTVASWESSRPAVASVDSNGRVKANKAGTAIITATATNGSVAQVKVIVRDESSDSTGNAVENEGNSSSTVDEEVPSTGEGTTEVLVIIGVLTLIIAAVIFRKKIK